jgi:hypothetical protein
MHFEGITKAGYTQYVLRTVGPVSALNIMASGSGVVTTQVVAPDMPTAGNVRIRGNITLVV